MCACSVDAAPDAETLRANKLTYFGNRLCPFAHRAWWAMHEKGVADQVCPSACVLLRRLGRTLSLSLFALLDGHSTLAELNCSRE